MPATSIPASESFPFIPQAPAFNLPLENGDRLSRAEFERRYRAMAGLKKAELIEGEVHMPSPVRLKQHGNPQSMMITLLGNYDIWTPGVHSGDNTSVRLDLDNEPQPDGLLLIDPECGGRVKLDADGIINGAPELVSEISSSTVSIDLGKKKHVYRRNQVLEYIVWRVLDRALDWFILRGSDYEPLAPDGSGVLKSETFPGLWLNGPAILGGDYSKAFETLLAGIQSPEHQAFAAALEAKRGQNR